MEFVEGVEICYPLEDWGSEVEGVEIRLEFFWEVRCRSSVKEFLKSVCRFLMKVFEGVLDVFWRLQLEVFIEVQMEGVAVLEVG